MFPIRVQKIKNSLPSRGSTSGNTTATTSTPQADGNMSSSSTKKKRALFPSLTDRDDIEDSSDSSLTEPSSDDNGDGNKDKGKAKQEDDDEDEDDDEMEWEDVLQATIEPASATPSSALRIEGDLHLTLDGNPNEFSA